MFPGQTTRFIYKYKQLKKTQNATRNYISQISNHLSHIYCSNWIRMIDTSPSTSIWLGICYDYYDMVHLLQLDRNSRPIQPTAHFMHGFGFRLNDHDSVVALIRLYIYPQPLYSDGDAELEALIALFFYCANDDR